MVSKSRRIPSSLAMLLLLVTAVAIKGSELSTSSPSTLVECEYIVDVSWEEWTRMGDLNCCFMQNEAEISVRDTKIANIDATVTALDFSHSKRIQFLPIDVSESFANLKALAALECQISAIADVNFRGLHRLKFLDLTENLIEVIPAHTFDDLVALEYVSLSDNRLRQVNGAVFAHLTRLRKALMVNNPCIDEVFAGGTCSIEQIPTIVDRKCGEGDGGNWLTCSRVLNSTWSGDWTEMDERRDCELDEGVRIDTRDFRFAERDDSVTGLVMSFNRNVFYLPMNVSESFENLQAYVALRCSIEELFVENFEGLSSLIILDLKGNRIQSVAESVFDSLVNLRVLRLSSNRIRFMNGKVVAPLKTLHQLHLDENDCIDRNFMDESAGEVVLQIDENCGFVRRRRVELVQQQDTIEHEISINDVATQITELKKSVDEMRAMLTKLVDDKNKVGN